MGDFCKSTVQALKEQVGPDGRVLLACPAAWTPPRAGRSAG